MFCDRSIRFTSKAFFLAKARDRFVMSSTIVVIDSSNLVLAFLICLGWQALFFVVASITKSDKVTDFAYVCPLILLLSTINTDTFHQGTNFAALAAILFGMCGHNGSARCIIVLLFIVAWGLRLALYLFARVLKGLSLRS
jgi:steroid 5-alpha reductase family enzyme